MRRVLIVTAYLLTTILFLALLYRGRDYYRSDYAERPRLEDYRSLRPAGTSGLLYGYIGAGMMILMLSYTLRKRTRLLGEILTLRNWLDLHIYLGIFGPLFILLHTSFKVQGLVAVSFWSMVVVALSGFFGRYLYLQIPRNIQGNELSLKDIEDFKQILNRRMKEDYGFDEEKIAAIDRIGQSEQSLSVGTGQALFQLSGLDLAGKRRLRVEIESQLRALGVAGAKYRQLQRLIKQRAKLQQRIAVLAQVHRLFHYWHVIHKPFAIIMYVIMLIHIGVAVWTGYGWNF